MNPPRQPEAAASNPESHRRGHRLRRRFASDVLGERPGVAWAACFLVSLALVGVFVLTAWRTFDEGLGIWGINNTVHWGIAISNTIWWIGIAHAGTLLSSVLLLSNSEWRAPLNRFAEAMALFAGACAATFPVIHLGVPQLFYWLAPYPFEFGVWPQFQSPLIWDVFAFSAYFVFVLVFWYVGLLPDLAVLRDRARTRPQRLIYGLFALGWQGSSLQWNRRRQCLRLLAVLALPLILFHSGGVLLFAAGTIPGWHDTVLPVYALLSGTLSGFAVLALLAVVLRATMRLRDVVTEDHLDRMAWAMLVVGLAAAFAQVLRVFHGWYAGLVEGIDALPSILGGRYFEMYLAAMVGNFLVLQLLWRRRLRRSPAALFAIAVAITAGMWVDRFVLLVGGLYRGFIPARWVPYGPTLWDAGLLIGTAGIFVMLFLLFVRILPSVSIVETSRAATSGEGPSS